MSSGKLSIRWLVVSALLLLGACQDATGPIGPPDLGQAAQLPRPGQDVAAWFSRSADEVLALPLTVFADYDEVADRLVFGVQNTAATFGVQNALARLGIPSSAYLIEVVQPIHFASSLRDRHRPTVGGLQIHWGQYLCTLGFNADHSGSRSFIMNSHCTDQQGQTGTTAYYQPTSTMNSNRIGTEADDPSYFKRKGGCSRGKVCRRSDAARALYDGATESSPGVIAKTTGMNTGVLALYGSFSITAQDNGTGSFAFGTPLHKVGRTMGWTQGTVSNTCVRVNVSGSNIQLLCQTLVFNGGSQSIVGSGDSGSPVFQITGGDDVTLIGLLWGGSSGGDIFVFSPLKNIQAELGGLTATIDGRGGGGPPRRR